MDSGGFANWRGEVLRGLFVIGALAAVSVFFFPLHNPDFFWHLSAGKYIVSHGSLPSSDFLSWTKAGAQWIDFEWLPQVFYYLLYSHGGYAAVFSLKVFLFACALFILFLTLRLYGGLAKSFAAAPIWAAALAPSVDLRPENFSLVFFSAELYFLEKFRLGKIGWDAKRFFFAAAVLFAVWANCHAGFVYGLVLAGCYLAGEACSAWLPAVYGGNRLGLDGAKKLLAAISGAVLGTLANGCGWKIYAVLWQHFRQLGEMERHIIEWRPPTVSNLYQWPYWALVLLAFGLFCWRALKRRDVAFSQLFALFYFGLASSGHSRNTAFFALAAVPYCVWLARDVPAKIKFSAAAALLLTALAYFSVFFWARTGDRPWRHSVVAEGACQFLAQNKETLSGLRLYNPWEWGGYVGWRLSPDYPVFQDGRYIFHEFLGEVQAARAEDKLWRAFLDKYRVDLVVLARQDYKYPVKTKFANGNEAVLMRPFYLFFMPKTEWALVYWDAYCMVYVRRSAVPAGWAEPRQFTIVRPDDSQSAARALAEGETSASALKAELSRFGRQLSACGTYGETASAINQWLSLTP